MQAVTRPHAYDPPSMHLLRPSLPLSFSLIGPFSDTNLLLKRGGSFYYLGPNGCHISGFFLRGEMTHLHTKEKKKGDLLGAGIYINAHYPYP